MGKLHLTYVSILHDMIRPLKFESKDIVSGGGNGGGLEQQSQAEQKLEISNT